MKKESSKKTEGSRSKERSILKPVLKLAGGCAFIFCLYRICEIINNCNENQDDESADYDADKDEWA